MNTRVQVDVDKLFELLSRKEIKVLSGRSYREDQINWLDLNDVPYKVDAKGWPQVYRCHALGVTVECA